MFKNIFTFYLALSPLRCFLRLIFTTRSSLCSHFPKFFPNPQILFHKTSFITFNLFFLAFFGELCWGKAVVASTKPQQWKKKAKGWEEGEIRWKHPASFFKILQMVFFQVSTQQTWCYMPLLLCWGIAIGYQGGTLGAKNASNVLSIWPWWFDDTPYHLFRLTSNNFVFCDSFYLMFHHQLP